MKLKYRTVFLSDLHLGSNGAQAEDLSRLLKRIQCDKLYLVGDILDMWRLKSRWYWPDAHNDVVRRILKLASKGTEVIYIPGNHDAAARQYQGMEFGGVKIMLRDVHTTQSGQRLLVTHGDQFDLVVQYHPILSMLGSVAYEWLLRINTLYNRIRAAMGLKYWSLSQYAKLKVKHACTFISRFEETLMAEAKRHKLDGVVCGHIHKAERREEDGLSYLNCGDWVESCSLLVENDAGEVELLDGLELLQSHEQERAEQKQRKKAKKQKSRLLPIVGGFGAAALEEAAAPADGDTTADELDDPAEEPEVDHTNPLNWGELEPALITARPAG